MASYTPGPPMIFGLNRYTAVPGVRLVISGHHLAACTQIEIGGVPVPAGDITALGHHRIAVVVPQGAVTAPVQVRSSYGADTSSFKLTISAPNAAPNAAPSGGPSPSNAPDSGFDMGAAMGAFSSVVARPFRSVFHSASNVYRAITTAQSRAPFAPGGDWMGYSVQSADYQKWNRSKERAKSYQDKAQAAQTQAERDRYQALADKAQGIAAQRGQAALGGAVAGGASGAAIGQGLGTSGVLSGIGGAVGMAFGPVGSAIGAVIGTVIEAVIGLAVKAVKKTFANIKAGGSLGEGAVTALVDGVKANFDAVRATGQSLVETLLGAMAPALGPGGAALARFGNQVTRFVGGALEGVFNGGGGLLKGAGRVAGIGAVGAGAAGGLMLGAMTGTLLGPIIGALVGSTIGKVVMKVVEGIADMGGKIIGTFGKVFGELGQLVSGLVGTVLNLMQSAKTALMEYSRAIYDLSSHSGRSIGASQNIVNTRLAFGMSPSQTSGAYSQFGQMPIFQNAIQSVWGVKGQSGSDEQLQSVVTQAKRLPLMLRRTMLSMMPEGEDFWLRLVGMPGEKIKSQLQFFKGMDLGSSVIKGAAEDLFLLQSRFDGFTQFVMRTLGAALLPVFTTAMESITGFLKANQGNIGGWIANVGRFFYVDLPSYIAKGVEVALTMIKALLNGIDTGFSAMRKGMGPVLTVFDSIINGVRKMMINVLAAFAAIKAAMSGNVFGAMGVYRSEQARLDKTLPKSHMAQSYAHLNRSGGPLDQAQQFYRTNILNPANAAANSGIAHAQSVQSAQGMREAAVNEYMKKIAANTARTAEAVDESGEKVANYTSKAMMDLVGVALRHGRRDDFYAARRA